MKLELLNLNGWIHVFKYDESNDNWEDILNCYEQINFPEEFLEDVKNTYGTDAVPEYKEALKNCVIEGE